MQMAKYKNGVSGFAAHDVDDSSRSDLESRLLTQNSGDLDHKEDELKKKHHETLVQIQLDPKGHMVWLVFT